MSLPLAATTLPLTADSDGVVRVGGTRVALDTVVFAFNQGATPEEIVSQYPSLALADVYGAISYYLQHQSEVEAYLRERAAQRDEVRRLNEERFQPDVVRARLLARRRERAS